MAERKDLVAQIAANKRRTVYLMSGFAIVITGAVVAFDVVFQFGPAFIVIAFVLALIFVWGSYFYSDKLAIAAARAKEADPQEYQQLHDIVEELCIGVGLPKPRVYVVDDPAPNAFATGRNPQHSAIAVTTGLLQIMNRAELEGVLAHELSHIRNYDVLISTIAVTLVGFVALLTDFGLRLLLFGGLGGRGRDNSGGEFAIFVLVLSVVFLILAPIAAKLMQFAVSRRREALADVSGVYITRNPQGLISALEQLQSRPGIVHHAPAATAHMWFASPLDKHTKDVHGWFNRLFETHPPLEQRIAALQEVAGTIPPPSTA
ncbi:MAG TPA: M48 family metalloprotease [Acidimicrobiia bacterium]|nr:M48 family metalloprotease [Acidimicrobiia bacterium]